MGDRKHWDGVYAKTAGDLLSWYQHRPERSLALIAQAGIAVDAPIIDIGGGVSPLVAELLRLGYREPWVLDVSAVALDGARAALGAQASRVHWVHADVTAAQLPAGHFALWHDRAVFHFLVDAASRAAYVAQARRTLKPGGHLVIATFAEDGPQQCSGLPVMRYDAAGLLAQFGDGFELLRAEKEAHTTPAGGQQSFRYCLLRLRGDRPR